MPCYHPMIRVEQHNREKIKAADGHYYWPYFIDYPDDLWRRLEELEDTPGYRVNQIIPCGKCIGCKLDYSREWANRGYLEAKQWEQNWFVTLTYDEEHLEIKDEVETSKGITYPNPGDWNGTLIPEHLTQFIKNVRQIMQRKYEKDFENWLLKNPDKKEPEEPLIRFMACGEYGDEGERPHYHIIFFNLNLPVEDIHSPHIIHKELYYKSDIMERAWAKKGIVDISEANWNTIAYTARYITKKISGKISEEHYAEKGQEPEFFRVSRMPGIGEQYFRDHYKEIYEKDEIIIKNKAGVVSSKPPKYYDRLYEQIDPEGFKEIQRKRKRRAKDAARIKDMTTSNGRLKQLEIEEEYQEEKTVKLIREFEKKST